MELATGTATRGVEVARGSPLPSCLSPSGSPARPLYARRSLPFCGAVARHSRLGSSATPLPQQKPFLLRPGLPSGVRRRAPPAAGALSGGNHYDHTTGGQQDNEDHGSTQITVLIALSVLLLTVPWMKDHPVTLLVPLMLFALPTTSQALRPLVSEALMSVFGAFRWFWRHHHEHHQHEAQQQFASQQQARAQAARHVHHYMQPQPTPQPWHQPAAAAHVPPSQHVAQRPMPRPASYAGAGHGPSYHYPAAQGPDLRWSTPARQSAVDGVVHRVGAVLARPMPGTLGCSKTAGVATSELVTPDLDFDEGTRDAPRGAMGRQPMPQRADAWQRPGASGMHGHGPGELLSNV